MCFTLLTANHRKERALNKKIKSLYAAMQILKSRLNNYCRASIHTVV